MQAAAKATKVSLFIFLLITIYTNYFVIAMVAINIFTLEGNMFFNF